MHKIFLSKVNPEVALNVETKRSVYQIRIIEGNEITIIGGWTSEGEIRFPYPTRATFMGSVFGESVNEDQICYGKRIQIKTKEMTFKSSVVLNVEIETPNWSYKMNWEKD